LHNPKIKKGRTAKLSRQWAGPYRVLKVRKPNLLIQHISSHTDIQYVHANRCKPIKKTSVTPFKGNEPSDVEEDIEQAEVIEQMPVEDGEVASNSTPHYLNQDYRHEARLERMRQRKGTDEQEEANDTTTVADESNDTYASFIREITERREQEKKQAEQIAPLPETQTTDSGLARNTNVDLDADTEKEILLNKRLINTNPTPPPTRRNTLPPPEFDKYETPHNRGTRTRPHVCTPNCPYYDLNPDDHSEDTTFPMIHSRLSSDMTRTSTPSRKPPTSGRSPKNVDRLHSSTFEPYTDSYKPKRTSFRSEGRNKSLSHHFLDDTRVTLDTTFPDSIDTPSARVSHMSPGQSMETPLDSQERTKKRKRRQRRKADSPHRMPTRSRKGRKPEMSLLFLTVVCMILPVVEAQSIYFSPSKIENSRIDKDFNTQQLRETTRYVNHTEFNLGGARVRLTSFTLSRNPSVPAPEVDPADLHDIISRIQKMRTRNVCKHHVWELSAQITERMHITYNHKSCPCSKYQFLSAKFLSLPIVVDNGTTTKAYFYFLPKEAVAAISFVIKPITKDAILQTAIEFITISTIPTEPWLVKISPRSKCIREVFGDKPSIYTPKIDNHPKHDSYSSYPTLQHVYDLRHVRDETLWITQFAFYVGPWDRNGTPWWLNVCSDMLYTYRPYYWATSYIDIKKKSREHGQRIWFSYSTNLAADIVKVSQNGTEKLLSVPFVHNPTHKWTMGMAPDNLQTFWKARTILKSDCLGMAWYGQYDTYLFFQPYDKRMRRVIDEDPSSGIHLPNHYYILNFLLIYLLTLSEVIIDSE